MPTLHTLNRSPSDRQCLSDCLAAMSPDDTLLLIEDGVYWALPAHRESLQAVRQLHALGPDVAARGLSGKIEVPTLDDEAFVLLCTTHDKVVSWF